MFLEIHNFKVALKGERCCLLWLKKQLLVLQAPCMHITETLCLRSSDILEADAKKIATLARISFDKDGPLLVVAFGRSTIIVASSIRQLASENVFVVQVCKVNRFDLVITPRNYCYPLTPQGRAEVPWLLCRWIMPCEPLNVIYFLVLNAEMSSSVLILGALHLVDPIALLNASSSWHDEFAPLPKPLCSILLDPQIVFPFYIGIWCDIPMDSGLSSTRRHFYLVPNDPFSYGVRWCMLSVEGTRRRKVEVDSESQMQKRPD